MRAATAMKIIWDLLRAAGFSLVVLGFLAFVLGIYSGYPTFHEKRTWPAVDAEVIQREIISRTSRSFLGRNVSGTVYSAAFIFRYQVNGRECIAQKDVGYRSSSESEMAKWVSRFPAGSHHTIRYDPENPLRISLAAGFDSISFAPTLALWRWALILVAAGLILDFLANRFGDKVVQ
jgi:uncharacterized protein DUF3592